MMKKQSYKNHKRYYIPHHFIFLPLISAMMGAGIVEAYLDQIHMLEWILFSSLSFCILYLAIMLRQHYALGNQDRIIRLEFRLRYFQLYGESSQKIEEQLSFSQIAALRFAGDLEFKILLQRTLKDSTSPDEIKRLIPEWKADKMRV
jgi:hypothetical protein